MSADLWTPIPMPILKVDQETADTVTLTLDAADSPMSFAPGQFNMLWLYGHGEVPISISGDPADPARLVHTIRGVGSVTRPMIALGEGDVLGVRGPYGTSWPVEAAEGADVVVVAGGIGLAPLRPAIYHLLRHRERYGRVLILYGARSPAEMLFVEQLHAWRGRFDLEVEVTVDHAGSDWRGAVGVVTKLLHRAHFDADDAVVMTCGPEIMMRFVAREAQHQGVPDANIHLSMERSMKCAVGLCGHCQWGADFVCRDGPVYRLDEIAERLKIQEL